MVNQDKKWILAKIDPEFEKKIREIALERVKIGRDTKMCKENSSIRRYTKAMTRYDPLWKILREAEFKE